MITIITTTNNDWFAIFAVAATCVLSHYMYVSSLVLCFARPWGLFVVVALVAVVVVGCCCCRCLLMLLFAVVVVAIGFADVVVAVAFPVAAVAVVCYLIVWGLSDVLRRLFATGQGNGSWSAPDDFGFDLCFDAWSSRLSNMTVNNKQSRLQLITKQQNNNK